MPRCVYKINEQMGKKTDVKFVDIENNYIDGETDEKHHGKHRKHKDIGYQKHFTGEMMKQITRKIHQYQDIG